MAPDILPAYRMFIFKKAGWTAAFRSYTVICAVTDHVINTLPYPAKIYSYTAEAAACTTATAAIVCILHWLFLLTLCISRSRGAKAESQTFHFRLGLGCMSNSLDADILQTALVKHLATCMCSS